MNYLLYDVETPNRYHNSICSCAWILHDGEKKIADGYQLINPETTFDNMNIAIHSIHPEDVEDAPVFCDYWNTTLKDLFENSIVIAHNSGFDMAVTSKALQSYGIEMPRIKCIDSLKVFHALLPEESCKLKNLAEKYCIEYDAHNAGEDVRALAAALDCIKKELNLADYEAVFNAAAVATENAASEAEKKLYGSLPSFEAHKAFVESIINSAKEKDVDLSDIHFAFHGWLDEPQIMRTGGLDVIIEALGGVYHKSVSGKVDYYVCFDESPSSTFQKAKKIAEDGKSHIQFINRDSFLDLLGYRTSHPDHDGPRAIRERKLREREEAIRHEMEKAQQKADRLMRMAEKKAAEEKREKYDQRRAVVQIDKETGIVICTFESLSIAAATIGISTKVIRDAATGKQKTAGGFCWKYKDEME